MTNNYYAHCTVITVTAYNMFKTDIYIYIYKYICTHTHKYTYKHKYI